MAIIGVFGKPGSGKTLWTVRKMVTSPGTPKLSNIITKGLSHVKRLELANFIDRKQIGQMKTGKPIYEIKFNAPFWKALKRPVDVILDEAHSIVDSRSCTTKQNKIIAGEFVALIRKLLGSAKGQGNLYILSQEPRKVDVRIRRDMQRFQYHVGYCKAVCTRCLKELSVLSQSRKFNIQKALVKMGAMKDESSEDPEPMETCAYCNGHDIHRFDHYMEVARFTSEDAMIEWLYTRDQRIPYHHEMIGNLDKYFDFYDTYQIDNLFEGW